MRKSAACVVLHRLRIIILLLASLHLSLPSSAMAQVAFESLEAHGAWDLLHDDRRDLLYISTADGEVLRYDVAGEVFLTPIQVGQRPLGDVAISADRSSLVVVEIAVDEALLPADWTGLFTVDLDSLVVSRISEPTEALDIRAFDALYLADGSLLISTIPHSRNSMAPVYRRDAVTGEYSVIVTMFTSSLFALSQDGQSVIISSLTRSVVTSRNVGFVHYQPATGLLRSRAVGGGFSPTFLQDSDRFAVANWPQFAGASSRLQLWRTTANSLRTVGGSGSPGTFFWGRNALALDWFPLRSRIYSTWKGTAGSAIIAADYADPSRGPTFFGYLDASTSTAATAETGGFFGRIEIHPDTPKLFVVTPDAVRIYNPYRAIDSDRDGVVDGDNCPGVSNPDQLDFDGDGLGDACNERLDSDGDEVRDDRDNCPDVPNSLQLNFDGTRFGNACNDHEDRDGDDWRDSSDNCPDIPNDQTDLDGDRLGDACDPYPLDADHVLAAVRIERDTALVEVARLNLELGLVSTELALCLEPPDADGDGVPDANDKCLETKAGTTVDGTGCAKSQFCESIEINQWQALNQCMKADWLSQKTEGKRSCQVNWKNFRPICVKY